MRDFKRTLKAFGLLLKKELEALFEHEKLYFLNPLSKENPRFSQPMTRSTYSPLKIIIPKYIRDVHLYFRLWRFTGSL